MRIDQILPNFSYGDAIGNHTLAVRDTLRRWNLTSEIWSHYTHHRLEKESRYFEEYRRVDHPDNVLFYHYSIGSVITEFLRGLSCRKVLVYHNITPPKFFDGVNRRAAWECRTGREELATLRHEVELALGDSEYNRRELEALGFPRTGVLPIFIPFEDYRQPPDRKVLAALAGGGPVVLHVGRFAPNKRIEDVVKAFHFLQRVRPGARLVLVGTDVNMENYSGAIRQLVERLETTGVVFPGHITFRQLLAYYAGASVYLSMSEHEGFCVPLVEAMLMELPVVAYASSAVPGTLGGGGILLAEKNFAQAGELLDRVISDEPLRERLLAAGRRRLEDFNRPARERLLREHLRSIGVDLAQSGSRGDSA